VLHIRGVPNDAVESEIIQLGLPFGRMTNLVLFRKKNQVSP
jgi:polypyrimidine tract-binding protein 2